MDNPDNLAAIRQRETDITKERIHKILSAGANVILTTAGIDDVSMKPFIDAGEAIAWNTSVEFVLKYRFRSNGNPQM